MTKTTILAASLCTLAFACGGNTPDTQTPTPEGEPAANETPAEPNEEAPAEPTAE